MTNRRDISAEDPEADPTSRLLQVVRSQRVDIGRRTPSSPATGVRRSRTFSGAQLPGARLSGVDLHGAALQQVDFSDTDLHGATLYDVDFRGANLRGANLRGADLRGSILTRAWLTETDLRQADLRGVSFDNVGDMNGADLRGADLRGVTLSDAMHGARIDGLAFFRSGWSVEQLLTAQACGAQLEGLEILPPGVRRALKGSEDGLMLSFLTPLNFRDEYILRGFCCAVLGPDTPCVMQLESRREGVVVTLSGVQQTALNTLAEVLHSRAWERAPVNDAERVLHHQLYAVLPLKPLINALSALVDRMDRIERVGPGGLQNWRPPVNPHRALQHLLLQLFEPVELRWWVGGLPGGKRMMQELPPRSAAPEELAASVIQVLEKRQCLDAQLFSSLITERRSREAEIRAVARLWSIEWYVLRDHDEV